MDTRRPGQPAAAQRLSVSVQAITARGHRVAYVGRFMSFMTIQLLRHAVQSPWNIASKWGGGGARGGGTWLCMCRVPRGELMIRVRQGPGCAGWSLSSLSYGINQGPLD
jgi:hypothetical protein